MIVLLRWCREKIALGRVEEQATTVKKFPVGVIPGRIMLLAKEILQGFPANGAILVIIPDTVSEPTVGLIVIKLLAKILPAAHGGNAWKKGVIAILRKILAA